ncbi:MAG TPA: DUF1329 domain-containing protein [Candidatus Binatia bacterium]|jgi:hypothetical protein|nr:DUF1329 domain-containing protein [Candidatus Binatia bacterium]
MLLRKITPWGVFVLAGTLALLPVRAHAQNGNLKEKLLEVFHPYREGSPQVEGITPGMKISKDNFQRAEKVLPPEILRVVQAGDLEITVQETTDVPLHAEYIAASIEHAGQAELGEDGELKNYTKGLPFPLLDPSDPQAGLKLAWDFRYRYMGDSLQTLGVLRSVNNSGAVERSVETRYARLYGMHRPNPDRNVREWEEEGTWWRDHSVVLRPQDLEGTQRLSFHHDADTAEDAGWIYDPQTRRTREVVNNHLETSFGLNFLVEDQGGFNGYLRNHTWRYQGEQVVLVPGIFKGTQLPLGGKNNWYPLIPWELRRVLIVEATPKASNHPYGKRRFYIDRQLFAAFSVFMYDHEGAHLRTLLQCFANPKFDPKNDVGAPVQIGNMWIDYQTDHASVWTADEVLISQPLPPKMFTVKEMVRKGK